jgi:hypothetical protein
VSRIGIRKGWLEAPRTTDVSGASLVLLAFLLVAGAVGLISPAEDSELRAADPLIRSARGPWLPVGLSLAICGAWIVRRPLDAAALRHTARLALFGAAVAASSVAVLRAGFGDTLPSFIPPEESAKAGLLLGLAAGTLEEAVFRLALLPGLVAVVRSRVAAPVVVAAVSAVLTGLAFAASHELGGAPDGFVLRWFVTRWLVPGVAMSLAYFWPGPAFIVAAHCTAHLLIPVAFR